MKCDICGGPKKPLLTSWYCPKDCDRPKSESSNFNVSGGWVQQLGKQVMTAWPESRLIGIANQYLPSQRNILAGLVPNLQRTYGLVEIEYGWVQQGRWDIIDKVIENTAHRLCMDIEKQLPHWCTKLDTLGHVPHIVQDDGLALLGIPDTNDTVDLRLRAFWVPA